MTFRRSLFISLEFVFFKECSYIIIVIYILNVKHIIVIKKASGIIDSARFHHWLLFCFDICRLQIATRLQEKSSLIADLIANLLLLIFSSSEQTVACEGNAE